MIYFVVSILSILLGAFVSYIILLPKLKATVQLDNEITQQNYILQNVKKNLEKNITELNATNNNLKNEYSILLEKKYSVNESIKDLKDQAEQASKIFYDQSMALVYKDLDEKKQKINLDVQQWKEEANKEYLNCLKENAENYQNTIEEQSSEIDKLENQITELSKIVKIAIEANKRAEEELNKKDFYKLNLSNEDLEEIVKIKSILHYFRNEEPICKIIWKTYYEKPYTDLVGRVIGSGTHTGIYKITNIENGKCYIGQATDLADRWRQHIKRGLGAEPATRNKLYPAMKELGPENFTFEVIEECPRNQLDAKEDYWQEYFGAKEFGYSIK